MRQSLAQRSQIDGFDFVEQEEIDGGEQLQKVATDGAVAVDQLSESGDGHAKQQHIAVHGLEVYRCSFVLSEEESGGDETAALEIVDGQGSVVGFGHSCHQFSLQDDNGFVA